MSMQFCAICSVSPSSEISTAVEKPTQLKAVAFSTNVDISDDESGMAKDILFKLWGEATEQMTQSKTISRSKNQRELKYCI